jgi:RecJ-like exonuclease
MSNLTGQAFIDSVEFYTRGLTAVSSGLCPGCEQCREDYGRRVPCSRCGGTGEVFIRPWGWVECVLCEGQGERLESMESFEDAWSNGTVNSEPFFSWRGCDTCGSSLGGDFEVWHAIDSVTGGIVHGERCCPDCMCYLANGDVPGDNDN